MKSIVIMFSIIFLAACKSTGVIEINNPSRDTTIMVVSNDENPTGFQFNIEGEINDTCKINGRPFGPGVLSQSVLMDQYNDTLYLNYQACKADSGQIRISYSF